MNLPLKKWGLVFALAITTPVAVSWSQEKGSLPTVPVSIIVSVEAKHGKEIPTIYQEDVRVFQDRDRLKVQD
jgi:hypothetical protein